MTAKKVAVKMSKKINFATSKIPAVSEKSENIVFYEDYLFRKELF